MSKLISFLAVVAVAVAVAVVPVLIELIPSVIGVSNPLTDVMPSFLKPANRLFSSSESSS